MATSWRDILHVPEFTDDSESAYLKRSREVEEWSRLWSKMHDRLGCQIIVHKELDGLTVSLPGETYNPSLD